MEADETTRNLIFKGKLNEFENLFREFISNNKSLKELKNLECYNFSSKKLCDNICKYCNLIRPDRSYHCKICRSCNRKIDHHCFVINNCVGFFNYKIFILMLFYGILTLSILCMAMVSMLKLYLLEEEVN